MFQIYFCVVTVVLSITLTIGLICGIYFRPPEIHTDQEIYLFAGGVAVSLVLLALGIVVIVIKKWRIKIEKNLIKED